MKANRYLYWFIYLSIFLLLASSNFMLLLMWLGKKNDTNGFVLFSAAGLSLILAGTYFYLFRHVRIHLSNKYAGTIRAGIVVLLLVLTSAGYAHRGDVILGSAFFTGIALIFLNVVKVTLSFIKRLLRLDKE